MLTIIAECECKAYEKWKDPLVLSSFGGLAALELDLGIFRCRSEPESAAVRS